MAHGDMKIDCYMCFVHAQPEGREKIAHGASRVEGAWAEVAPARGRKDLARAVRRGNFIPTRRLRRIPAHVSSVG